MATQIVMDRTGDTRHYFDADDTEAVFKAEERFNVLISVGFTAAVRDAEGEVTVTRSFDPTAEETLFFPRLVGGQTPLCFDNYCATRRSVSDYFCRNEGAAREFCASDFGGSLAALTRPFVFSRATDTEKGKHAASSC